MRGAWLTTNDRRPPAIPYTIAGPRLGDRRLSSFVRKPKKLASWNRQRRRAARDLSLIEYRVCSHVCWLGSQHLLLTVNQVAVIEGSNFEAVSMGDRIRGAGLDAVSAENTSIVIDV